MWTRFRRTDTIEDKVNRFRTFLNEHESLGLADGDCYTVFENVSHYLSGIVYQFADPTKFDDEIFRLCHGDEQCSTCLQRREYVRVFLRDYVDLYRDIIRKYRHVNVIGGAILERICKHSYGIDLLGIITFFIVSVDVQQIFLGMKMLKMILCDKEELRELGFGTDLQLLVYTLKVNSVKSAGVTNLTCYLAWECFEIFSNPFYVFEGGIDPIKYIEGSSFETKKKFLSKIFRVLVYNGFATLPIYEQYYVEKIFMSAKTRKEREQYMEALLEAFDNSRRGKFRDDITYEFKNAVDQIFYYLTKRYGERSQSIEDELRCIDKYQGIKIDPYDGPNIVDGAVVSELSRTDAEDLIVEKCLVYDYFMRCLQILTILHTAFLRREEIYWICKGVKGDHKKIFRSNDIESYVRGKLSDKSKCGNLPWYIEMIIKKCPFVVFESPDQDITDGLIKILKKEYVDEDLENKIYEAIKSVDDDSADDSDDDDWYPVMED